MLDSEDMSNAALPFTEKAFPEIESLYGSDWVREVYSGVKATTALARSRAPDADVLYFATHGVIAEDPRESYIALAKTAGSDGRLRVSDIYEMKIRVNLVILAACKTAQGRVTGDGVDGFSRAFALAGSANLITTLWSVHEEQMLEVMGYFHEHWLKEKLSKARALRKAQLQRLSIYRNQPNVWAGTVLYGPQDDQQNR
jgi:CHAT domain-containing protein